SFIRARLRLPAPRAKRSRVTRPPVPAPADTYGGPRQSGSSRAGDRPCSPLLPSCRPARQAPVTVYIRHGAGAIQARKAQVTALTALSRRECDGDLEGSAQTCRRSWHTGRTVRTLTATLSSIAASAC